MKMFNGSSLLDCQENFHNHNISLTYIHDFQLKCLIPDEAGKKCSFFNHNAAEKQCQLDFCDFPSADRTIEVFSGGPTTTQKKGWFSYLPVERDYFDPNTMTFRGYVKVPTSTHQQSLASGTGTGTSTTKAPAGGQMKNKLKQLKVLPKLF